MRNGCTTQAGELALPYHLAIVGSFQALGRPNNPPRVRQMMQCIIMRYLMEQQAPV